jgi:hypothetical protein
MMNADGLFSMMICWFVNLWENLCKYLNYCNEQVKMKWIWDFQRHWNKNQQVDLDPSLSTVCGWKTVNFAQSLIFHSPLSTLKIIKLLWTLWYQQLTGTNLFVRISQNMVINVHNDFLKSWTGTYLRIQELFQFTSSITSFNWLKHTYSSLLKASLLYGNGTFDLANPWITNASPSNALHRACSQCLTVYFTKVTDYLLCLPLTLTFSSPFTCISKRTGITLFNFV